MTIFTTRAAWTYILFFRLSEKETDMRDKLAPSISYLRKLGPEHLEQIFECSRWLFEQDRDMAFEASIPCPRSVHPLLTLL
jgi:hypothetical protein